MFDYLDIQNISKNKVHKSKFWNYIVKRSFSLKKNLHNKNSYKTSWIDLPIETTNSNKIEEAFERRLSNSNVVFENEGYCDFKDFKEIKFGNKRFPEIFYLIVNLLYGNKICNQILKNHQINKRNQIVRTHV